MCSVSARAVQCVRALGAWPWRMGRPRTPAVMPAALPGPTPAPAPGVPIAIRLCAAPRPRASAALAPPFEDTVRSSRSLATPTVRDSIPFSPIILPATAVDYRHYTRAFQPMITSCTLRVPECLALANTPYLQQGPRREKGARAAAWIYRLSMRPPESISEVARRDCSLLQSEGTLEATPTRRSLCRPTPYLSSRRCTEPLAVGGR